MNASKSETTIFGPESSRNIVFANCPCQDLLQPCGHEEAVDLSLKIFNLQNFILALVLPDDDIARSAVTVEGDREDRHLGSLRFFLAGSLLFAKDDGFHWPDASEIFFLSRRSTKAFTLLYKPQVF